MPSGKVSYGNVNAGTGKPKSQGGSSTGREAKFKAHKPAVLINTTGKPADKGVNR
jgi:hypothetical protein